MLYPYCFLGKKGVIKGLGCNRLFYREIQMPIPILKFAAKGDLERDFWKEQVNVLWTSYTFKTAESSLPPLNPEASWQRKEKRFT